jgi:hypothetical protein
MDEMQRANPRARRRALILIGGMTLLGAVAIASSPSWISAVVSWIRSEPQRFDERLAIARWIASAVVALPTAAFAAYFWRLASAVIAADRFPPPGLAVVQDTPIVSGAAARRRGRLLRIVAVAVLLPAVAVIVIFWKL